MKQTFALIVAFFLCGLATAQQGVIYSSINPTWINPGQNVVLNYTANNIINGTVYVDDLTDGFTLGSGMGTAGQVLFTPVALGLHTVVVGGQSTTGMLITSSVTFTVGNQPPVPPMQAIPFTTMNANWLSPCTNKPLVSKTKFAFRFNDTCYNATFGMQMQGSNANVTNLINSQIFNFGYSYSGKQNGFPFASIPVWYSSANPPTYPNMGIFFPGDTLIVETWTAGFGPLAQQNSFMWGPINDGDFLRTQLNLFAQYNGTSVFQLQGMFGAKTSFYDWGYSMNMGLAAPLAPVQTSNGSTISFFVDAESNDNDASELIPFQIYLKDVGTGLSYNVPIDANHGNLWGLGNEFLGCGQDNYFQFHSIYLDSLNLPTGNYSICIRMKNAVQEYKTYCTQVFPYVAKTTAMEEVVESNFAIFPNPAIEVLNLNLDENQLYEISDFSGRVVVSGEGVAGLNTISVSSLTSGFYTITLMPGGSCGGCKTKTAKFVIAK